MNLTYMSNNYKNKYQKYKRKYLLMKYGGSTNLSSLEFPYYKYYYDLTSDKFRGLVQNNKVKINHFYPPKVKDKVNNLEKFKDQYLFIEINWHQTKEIDEMSNYFTEPCRVLCNTKNNISPIKYWQLNKQKLIQSIQGIEGNQIKSLRSKIYDNNPHCTTFKISVGLKILEIFKAKKWLDISAGWGDRLLCAIGHGVDLYCGVDPNKCLHPHYQDMIRKLVPEKDRNKYILIQDGFETAKLPDEKFDLVFSSPPFFDVEEYSAEESDSYNKYKRGEIWVNNFLLPSIKKAYDHLEDGGHMVLYIGEGKTYKYLKKMLDETKKFMKYLGKIYYYYDDYCIPRRFFVWKKENFVHK